MQKKIKRKIEKGIHKKAILDWILIAYSLATAPEKGAC
jgi:hypothetical protein